MHPLSPTGTTAVSIFSPILSLSLGDILPGSKTVIHIDNMTSRIHSTGLRLKAQNMSFRYITVHIGLIGQAAVLLY
ncbi:hypothetical protein PM082_001391 [Marasmius tenuissimus]|nr:hypothetical protein PM082_001391 [Marasmius tenuissimus]